MTRTESPRFQPDESQRRETKPRKVRPPGAPPGPSGDEARAARGGEPMMVWYTDYEGEDVIDSRDLIETAAEVREYLGTDEGRDDDDARAWLAELDELEASGITDWEYGVTLVRDSYFVEYAQQFAEDIGAVPDSDGSSWPTYCIDWEWAARELRIDYSAVDAFGVTWLFRY